MLEDHEFLVDTLLAWPENTTNLIFFEERHEKFGLFEHPEHWMPPPSSTDGDCATHKSLDSSLPARSQAIFAYGDRPNSSGVVGPSEPRPDLDLPDYREYLFIKVSDFHFFRQSR